MFVTSSGDSQRVRWQRQCGDSYRRRLRFRWSGSSFRWRRERADGAVISRTSRRRSFEFRCRGRDTRWERFAEVWWPRRHRRTPRFSPEKVWLWATVRRREKMGHDKFFFLSSVGPRWACPPINEYFAFWAKFINAKSQKEKQWYVSLDASFSEVLRLKLRDSHDISNRQIASWGFMTGSD